MGEIVLDPGFDDPDAWNDIAAPVTIAGSQLTVLSGFSLSFGATPPLEAVIGQQYNWELDVEQISAIGNYGISFGGVTFWVAPKAAGVHSGTFVATHTTALSLIHLVGMNKDAIYNSLSIVAVDAKPVSRAWGRRRRGPNITGGR
jgi:hypothetical protein